MAVLSHTGSYELFSRFCPNLQKYFLTLDFRQFLLMCEPSSQCPDNFLVRLHRIIVHMSFHRQMFLKINWRAYRCLKIAASIPHIEIPNYQKTILLFCILQ